MSTALATQGNMAVLEQVVIQGDLSKLNPADRVNYYKQVCESVGLNPLTKPFEYITLNGKLTLYARRDATDQLRKLNGVSIVIAAREVVEDCYVVTARATDKTGRHDESIGAVPIASLKGEFRSNAMMKAETKAKRRVTLSICGLGWLDETETDSIPQARYPKPRPVVDDDGVITNPVAERPEAATPGPVGGAPIPAAPNGSHDSDTGPETREQTIKRLCAATASNRTNLLDNAEVKHEDELSQEDYDSLVRLLTRRLNKLADRAQA